MSSVAPTDAPTTFIAESTPLLQDTTPSINGSSPACRSYSAVDSESQKVLPRHLPVTPVPKKQLAALCVLRTAEPVNYTQIFPYINEFMSSCGLADPSRVGFYSGIVESSFAVAQIFSIIQWAKLSDRIGRRPVILAGTLGVMITTLMFGVSSSFPMMVLSRFLAGIFCGNVAVLQAVLCEITDSTNQAIAFPIFGFTWPIGTIFGSLIGGSLARPASKFELFNVEFFRQYPYFLPCFVSALTALMGTLLGWMFLQETHPLKQPQRPKFERTMSEVSDTSTLVDEDGAISPDDSDELKKPDPEDLSLTALLRIPSIRCLSLSGFTLSFFSTAFDVVFVLFAYSPIHSGGLAFADAQIGYTLAIAGLIASAIQLILLPILLRRFDITKMYTFCMYLWPCAFALFPLLNKIAKSAPLTPEGKIASSEVATAVWAGIALVMLCSRTGNIAYGLSMILAKQHSPSPAVLGSVNGLVNFAMCLSRAVSPAVVSSAFAFSQEYNFLGGHAWAGVFVLLSFGGCSLSKDLSQGQGASIPNKARDDVCMVGGH